MRGASVKVLFLCLDVHSFRQTLSALSALSERLPEFRERLLGLLNSGEELVAIDDEIRTAPRASDLVVGFKPSDGLLDLISAFRASHPDCLVFKHFPHPFRSDYCNITSEGVQ